MEASSIGKVKNQLNAIISQSANTANLLTILACDNSRAYSYKRHQELRQLINNRHIDSVIV